VVWDPELAQEIRGEVLAPIDEWFHQLPVRPLVRSEAPGRVVNRAVQDGRMALEGMRERGDGMDPLEAVIRKGQRSKERRYGGERVDRGTDVVNESGKRELRRTAAATDGVLGFEYENLAPGARQGDGGRETIRPRADDDGFVAACRQDPVAASAAASSSWMVMASSRRVEMSPLLA
jgi:hypothetical protein